MPKRREILKTYDAKLDFTKIRRLKIRDNTIWNFAYYPIIFQSEKNLLEVIKDLNKVEIFPRRYFYPSLNKLPN